MEKNKIIKRKNITEEGNVLDKIHQTKKLLDEKHHENEYFYV